LRGYVGYQLAPIAETFQQLQERSAIEEGEAEASRIALVLGLSF
jgi:hypothetical protein